MVGRFWLQFPRVPKKREKNNKKNVIALSKVFACNPQRWAIRGSLVQFHYHFFFNNGDADRDIFLDIRLESFKYLSRPRISLMLPSTNIHLPLE